MVDSTEEQLAGARIDYHDDDLDDVAVPDVSLFRLERMNDQCFWLRLYRNGKPDIVFWLGAFYKQPDGESIVAASITGEHEFDSSE